MLGLMPNLGRLVFDDRAATLSAELPELSPVNWNSLATGLGPGGHGIFGFTRINPRDYSIGLTDSTCLGAPSIFERLSRRGLVSRVLNLPGTYPAKPLRGMLVAGFVAPELSGAVYPPVLAHQLRAAGYKLEADTSRGAADPDYLLSELRLTLASRAKALDFMWPDLNWDLFVLVLTEFDRLAHFFLPALTRPEHPLAAKFQDFMRDWDALIGRVLARFAELPEPKRLLVMADHGFGELETELDLNAWLRQAGYQPGLPLAGEWEAGRLDGRASAFALDPGRIYLHDRERFSRGRLSKSEALALREKLRESLLELRFAGEPALREVFRGEELYEGPYVSRAPDLVCLARPGVSLTGKFDRAEIFGVFGRFGCHSAEGAIFFDSQGARPARPREVGQLILDYFGAGGSLAQGL